MIVTVDFEYYNSHFPKVSESRFDALIYKAQGIVGRALGDTTRLTSDEQTLIKDCICEVLNQLDINESTNGLSSISNNGYSKSFVAQDAEQRSESIESIIHSYFGGTRLTKSYFIGY